MTKMNPRASEPYDEEPETLDTRDSNTERERRRQERLENMLGSLKVGAERAAFSASLLTGWPAFAYVAGVWPFAQINANEYWITKWITGHEGPVLEGPGTRWFVWPVISEVTGNARDKKGNLILDNNNNPKQEIITIPGTYQQTDSKDMWFTTQNKLTGLVDVQHAWIIPTKRDAYKFHWELDRDIGIVEDAVISKISETIEGKVWAGEEKLLERYYIDNLVRDLNKPNLTEEEDPTKRSVYDLYGVKTVNIRLLKPRPSKESAKILQTPIRALLESQETAIQAAATARALNEIYIPKAKEALGSRATKAEVAVYAMRLAQMDNAQQMAANGARPIIVSGSFTPS